MLLRVWEGRDDPSSQTHNPEEPQDSPIRSQSPRIPWERYLLGIAFSALAWFLISHHAEAGQVVRTLSEGRWGWLLAAATLQVLYYAVRALAYHLSFQSIGISARWRDLWPALLAALAVGEVAPVAGSAVVVRYATGRDRPPERAILGTLLGQAWDRRRTLLRSRSPSCWEWSF